MTTSNDLREALERWDSGKFELDAVLVDFGIELDQSIFDALDGIVVAARCWLDLTSDENVAVGAKALETEARKNPVESSYMPGMSSRIMSQPIEDVARAVLEAVRSNQP